MEKKWAVWTRVGSRWSNLWFETDERGVATPALYETREEAQADMEAVLANVRSAFMAGDLSSGYDPNDYRVVQVKP